MTEPVSPPYKLPDEVEKALRNCDIYGDDAYGVQTPRASLRLSIAKAIRDAEERMRERAAKVCDKGVRNRIDVDRRFVAGAVSAAIPWGRNAEAERLADEIRSLPLENA